MVRDTAEEEIVVVASTILKSGSTLAAGDILIVHLVIEGETTIVVLKREEITTLTQGLRDLEDLLLGKHLRKVSNFSSIIILESVLYVGNLPSKVTEETLCEIFSLYGKIISCDLV